MNKLVLPFTISPSVSNIVLHVSEIGTESYIEFDAWFKDDSHYERMKVEFKRLIGVKYDDIDENVEPGIGIIYDSNWLKIKNQNQKKYHPDFKDSFKDVKHYYFKGHDVNAQVLAEDIVWKSLGKLDLEQKA